MMRISLVAPAWVPRASRQIEGVKQYLGQFIQMPEWRSMDDDTRREFLKETMTEFRASAREGLKERFPELSRTADLPPMPKGFVLPPVPPGLELAK